MYECVNVCACVCVCIVYEQDFLFSSLYLKYFVSLLFLAFCLGLNGPGTRFCFGGLYILNI